MPSLTVRPKREKGSLSRHNELRAPKGTNAHGLLSSCATGSGAYNSLHGHAEGPRSKPLGKQTQADPGSTAPADIPTLISNPKGCKGGQGAGPNSKAPMIWLRD